MHPRCQIPVPQSKTVDERGQRNDWPATLGDTMSAAVVFKLSGTSRRVPAGGLIGHAPCASLRLVDPGIREAHAIVSRKQDALVLRSLGGPVMVGRVPREAVELTVGRTLSLSDDVQLEVEALRTPSHTLALDGVADAPILFESDVSTLYADPWRLTPGYHPAGIGWISADGDAWLAHIDGETFTLREGSRLMVAGRMLRVVSVPLDLNRNDAAPWRTVPLHIVARHETAHIHRPNRRPLVLSGMSAKILSELVRFAAPVPWDWVATELFGPIRQRSARMRWDRNLRTLRRKLREAGVRDGLVCSDGHGNVELVLGPKDSVLDES